MTGRIIPGRFGAKPEPRQIDVAPFERLVDHLNSATYLDERGVYCARGGIESLIRDVAAAAMAPGDDRAKCSDCAEPATRDDGLCKRCRRHRQELAQ